MSALAPPARRVPAAVPVAVVLAWGVAAAAETGGFAHELHHGGLIEGGLPVWAALVLFLLAWQLMTAAMMLPSSLPFVDHFWAASRGREDARRSLAAFLGGYALVWSAFGAAAFAGDTLVHRTVDATPALEQRPWLIAGVVLLIAGAFQFSSLKERCLDECRHPAAYLLRHYRRGVPEAFRLGRGHGLFCLGCCWALMLLMFAAGFANLDWMAALAGLMAYEKIGRRGPLAARIAGVVFLAWGAVLLAQPHLLPTVLRGY
jgi:predicted metal-binding membrane protein